MPRDVTDNCMTGKECLSAVLTFTGIMCLLAVVLAPVFILGVPNFAPGLLTQHSTCWLMNAAFGVGSYASFYGITKLKDDDNDDPFAPFFNKYRACDLAELLTIGSLLAALGFCLPTTWACYGIFAVGLPVVGYGVLLWKRGQMQDDGEQRFLDLTRLLFSKANTTRKKACSWVKRTYADWRSDRDETRGLTGDDESENLQDSDEYRRRRLTINTESNQTKETDHQKMSLMFVAVAVFLLLAILAISRIRATQKRVRSIYRKDGKTIRV